MILRVVGKGIVDLNNNNVTEKKDIFFSFFFLVVFSKTRTGKKLIIPHGPVNSHFGSLVDK